jgi:hypothetical protein
VPNPFGVKPFNAKIHPLQVRIRTEAMQHDNQMDNAMSNSMKHSDGHWSMKRVVPVTMLTPFHLTDFTAEMSDFAESWRI